MNLDPLAEKYYEFSPYNNVLNNPISNVDPDGMDVILLLWTTNEDRWGHAALAVSNYKKDEDGNYIEDEDGNKIEDGTYTFYNLWPGDEASIFDNIDGERKPDYEVGKGENGMIKTLADILYGDPTGEYIGESDNYYADGLMRIDTDFKTDQEVKEGLESIQESKKKYQNLSYNCADYCKDGLNIIQEKNGEITLYPNEQIGRKFSGSTAGNLWRQAVKYMKSTYIIRNPGEYVNKSFKEKRGKSLGGG